MTRSPLPVKGAQGDLFRCVHKWDVSYRSWQYTPSYWWQCVIHLTYEKHEDHILVPDPDQICIVIPSSATLPRNVVICCGSLGCHRTRLLNWGRVKRDFTKNSTKSFTWRPKMESCYPRKSWLRNQEKNAHITPLFHWDRRKIKFLAPS